MSEIKTAGGAFAEAIDDRLASIPAREEVEAIVRNAVRAELGDLPQLNHMLTQLVAQFGPQYRENMERVEDAFDKLGETVHLHKPRAPSPRPGG